MRYALPPYAILGFSRIHHFYGVRRFGKMSMMGYGLLYGKSRQLIEFKSRRFRTFMMAGFLSILPRWTLVSVSDAVLGYRREEARG